MRFSPAIAVRLATLVLVSACAGVYAAAGAVAKPDPAAPYLGMSVTDILACAGEPHSRFESGPNKETLVFRYKGTGPVPAEKAKADDKIVGRQEIRRQEIRRHEIRRQDVRRHEIGRQEIR